MTELSGSNSFGESQSTRRRINKCSTASGLALLCVAFLSLLGVVYLKLNEATRKSRPANPEKLIKKAEKLNCYYDHHPENGECLPNICVCANGTADNYRNCQGHGRNECDACNVGFKLVDEACVVDDGCADYQHMEHGKCTGNICTCEHGTPDDSEFCAEHGKNECRDCDSGYEIDGEFCYAIK